MDSIAFYDGLSSVYDVMFPLSTQQDRMAFLDKLLVERGLKTVLDCGCGTGRQAIDLSLRGFLVTGADISEKMLAIAKENALANGTAVNWLHSDFASVAKITGDKFDAVICIGNSLPHVKDSKELASSLSGMTDAIGEEGLLVVHLRNYDMVLRNRQRLMPTLHGSHESRDYIFQRVIDFLPDGRIIFNIITLCKEVDRWKPAIMSTIQYPATWEEIRDILLSLNLKHITAHGGFKGEEYDPNGETLIVTARK